jgi:hypothetical protein
LKRQGRTLYLYLAVPCKSRSFVVLVLY